MANLNEQHRHCRSRGGRDDEENLVTACVGCHDLVHDNKVAIAGTAPHGLTFHLGTTPGRDAQAETYRQEVRTLL